MNADMAWILTCSALVLLMTPGLGFFLWWHGESQECGHNYNA